MDDDYPDDDDVVGDGVCEVCLCRFRAEDLEDGVTLSADCCERCGLCIDCREYGNHDCDD